MRKKVISVLFAIFFLFFICVIDYPFVSQLINDYRQGEVVSTYETGNKSLSDQEIETELKEAAEYNRSLVSGVNKQRFPDAFGVSGDGDPYYNSQLDLSESGVMATIQIPKIDVNLPIYHTTNDFSLNNGVGHEEGTSLPVGGKDTHSCLAAHRGIPSKKLFTDLDQIKVDDQFFIKVYSKTLAYQVYDIEVVTPDNLGPLLIQKDKDLVTLITCTTYGINTHRIFVHANRIPYHPGMEDNYHHDLMYYLRQYWWILVTILLLFWLIFLEYRFNRKPKPKNLPKTQS